MSKKKIGVVSITPQVRDASNVDFNTFYDSYGKNTGNYMFTQAMYRQFDADIRHVGFGYKPEQVNAELDHIVIPAANWLNHNANWDWLSDIIERTEIPVTTIGIGLQADSTSLDAVKVSASALRFAQVISKSSKFISARGDFTKAWLNSVGIHNVVTTGCPSLYMKINYAPELHPEDRLVIQSTRYGVTEAFAMSRGINKVLFEKAAEFDEYMIYQSEIEETQFLVYGGFEDPERVGAMMAQLYNLPDTKSVYDYIKRNGRIFFDLENWSNFVRSTRGVIGTRLHGAILALNSGVPAVLVPHDSRTGELAEFAKIPSASPDQVAKLTDRSEYLQLLNSDHVAKFYETRNSNSLVYRQFLMECGLPVLDAAVL